MAAENRLARETSPYLLQHAHNPVDWYPWGAEALERARREDKPILLSIGYAACHWCHVMERESFENEAIAAQMNESFVCIKVDREERPDLDDIYMSATVAMSGSGGWPMTVFLTPEQEPFFAGTYFPPDDRYGRPGFRTVLAKLAELWRNERAARAAASQRADRARATSCPALGRAAACDSKANAPPCSSSRRASTGATAASAARRSFRPARASSSCCAFVRRTRRRAARSRWCAARSTA